MALIEISVTAEDIKKGERCSLHTCPVALALARAQKKKSAWVDGVGTLIGERYIRLPLEVQTFILQFDKRVSVEPLKFQLEI